MKIPHRFRKIPPYIFDGDGQFNHDRIKGKDKRIMRKKQIRHYLKGFDENYFLDGGENLYF